MPRVRIMKDDDGHTYFVPVGLEAAFDHYVHMDGEEEMPREFKCLNSHLSCYSFADPQYDPEGRRGR